MSAVGQLEGERPNLTFAFYALRRSFVMMTLAVSYFAPTVKSMKQLKKT